MSRRTRQAMIYLACTVAGAALVISPVGAGVRDAFVSEQVNKEAVPIDARKSPIPPQPLAGGAGAQSQPGAALPQARSDVDRMRRKQIEAQRRFWGWTAALELQAKTIFVRDPVFKTFFAGRNPLVVNSGPWNADNSRKVIGGLLTVQVNRPVHGIHRLPGIASYKKRKVRMFRIDPAGARQFEVIVLYSQRRVAQVFPLTVPKVKRDSRG